MKPPVIPVPARPVGRRKFVVTEKDKNHVTVLVAVGTEQNAIASILGISPKTLRKHFAYELANAYALVRADIAGKLIQKARGGDVFAQIFYMKTHGWSERIVVADGGVEELDLTKLSDGEIAARLARLRRGTVAARKRE